MYKKEVIFDIQYEEVSSEELKTVTLKHDTSPSINIPEEKVKTYKSNRVAKMIGAGIASGLVWLMIALGQVIYFFTTLAFSLFGCFLWTLKEALRDIFTTSYATPFATPRKSYKANDDIDWRDIPTGQHRRRKNVSRHCHEEVSRHCRKEGENNVYINIHNY